MSQEAISQQPYFDNYQIKDGLPSTMVYDVFQDSKGFIWFGTNVGISRFDGYHFENFTTINGLPDNEVFTIYEDSVGRIWFLTFNGKLGFYLDGQFHNSSNTPSLKHKPSNTFLSAASEDRQGNVWIFKSRDDIFLFDSLANKIVYSYPESSFQTTWPHQEEGVYFTYGKGLGKIKKGGDIELLQALKFDRLLSKGHYSESGFFISNYKSIYKFNPVTEQLDEILTIDEVQEEIIRVFEKDSILWVGTKHGVYQYTAVNGQYTHAKVKKYLSDYMVSGILVDREGNWWFSTLNAGVFFVPTPDITHYGKSDGLPDNKLYCLAKDFQNKLWIGSTKRRYATIKDNQIENFQLIGQRDERINHIRHLSPSESWIVTKEISLLLDNNKKTYLGQPSGDILKDQFGGYWLAMSNIIRLNKSIFQDYLVDENDPFLYDKTRSHTKKKSKGKILDNSRILALTKDQNKNIWAASTSGLFYYQSYAEGFAKRTGPIINEKVNDVIYDPYSDLVWAASDTKGIYAVSKDSIRHHISKKEGLSSPISTAIKSDNKGNIWVGTVSGLNKISSIDGAIKVKNFSKFNGLSTIKINALEIMNEHVYIATDEGLVVVPDDIEHQYSKPPLIHLTAFNVNDSTYLNHPKRFFSANQKAILFSFLGLSFKDQGAVRYKYRISGLDENWKVIESKSVQYESIPPGQYTFEVKALNKLDVESIETAKLSFEIDRPYWQKPLFVIPSLCCFFLIGYLLWRYRLLRLRKQYELKQRLVQAENEKLEIEKNYLELELRALRMQMNPHFLFNALNTIKGYYADNKIRLANNYIHKLAKLLRLILENADKFISLEKEIQILRFYIDLIESRYSGKFEYEIQVDPDINIEEIAIPPMLLQPMIENAIIHGLIPLKEKGKLEITFHKQDQLLVATVWDNGVGRKASHNINKLKQHKSKAVEITQERLRMINKGYNIQEYFKIVDLVDAHGIPSGTKVIVSTPFKKIW